MPYRDVLPREKEAKKEAFRKYLDSSGAIDSLTKGGPSQSEYERLQAELTDLRTKYNELLATHQETVKELEELKNSHTVMSSTESTDEEVS